MHIQKLDKKNVPCLQKLHFLVSLLKQGDLACRFHMQEQLRKKKKKFNILSSKSKLKI